MNIRNCQAVDIAIWVMLEFTGHGKCFGGIKPGAADLKETNTFSMMFPLFMQI